MTKEKSTMPEDIKTETQITSADQLLVDNSKTVKGEVSELEVEQANLLINPDVDSMESRG